jgi:hypothetical protein
MLSFGNAGGERLSQETKEAADLDSVVRVRGFPINLLSS